ncbi:hypothetical protein [uncultured Winogradskyella sp.]|uniref:hypothetical protein n=1 Tax=uncultured Winogradskyella sp. TaxID=395353 RepID=UPI00262F8B2B|nr:hypothetical protein [uncultured Winogradskyella sp.]
MSNYQFSLANRVNVNIKGLLSKSCLNFIKLIYENFDKPLEDPKSVLNVTITDSIPNIENVTSLGKDCVANDKTVVFNTGHFIVRTEKGFDIGVPTKVKRGRIPFKRITPGRHITDELIEPFMQILLLESNATFVHASSVLDNGKVDVIMGWRGTGKTNAILKELNTKEIWSDDLSVVDTEGFVYPYLRPIRLYSYNLPLIDKNYRAKHNLDIKKFITPPWQPVHYLPLKNKNTINKAKLNKLYYLNRPNGFNLPKDAEEIMNFEQLFFDHYKIIMKHLGILEEGNSIESVLNSAMNQTNY